MIKATPRDVAEVIGFRDALDLIRRAPGSAIPFWRTRARRTAEGYEYLEPRASAIAALTKLDLDVACLAAVIASEAPDVRKFPQYSMAIASMTLTATEESDRPLSVYELVTRDRRHPSASGHFGRQEGRWCATMHTPNARHVSIARLALGGHAGNWENAARWVSPRVHDLGFQNGKPIKNAEQIICKRYTEGWKWIGPTVGTDGELILDAYVLCCFAREGVPLGDALAMVEDGRRRWRIRPKGGV